MDGINVLSLFDGISCGQIALKQAGIKVNQYFASEIDKNSIKITQKNFKDTIQLGDVRNVKGTDLPKIDLLIAGSPCQGFSYAGKQLNFDDDRSKLFFEFVRILNEVKPEYFLLENVPMKKEYEMVITKHLNIEPIYINSSRFCAQSRERVYWTNINASEYNLFGDFMKSNIQLPKKKDTVIADVLGIPIVNYRSDEIIMTISDDAKMRVRKNYVNQKELAEFLKSKKKGKKNQEIADELKVPKTEVEHWFRTDKYGSIPNEDIWMKLKDCLGFSETMYDKLVMEFEIKESVFDMSKRIYHIDGKHPTLTAASGGWQRKNITDGKDLFYLRPQHVEILQTVPVGYTEGVSSFQRLRALGNGWTVAVVEYIFSHLPEKFKTKI